MAEGWPIGGYQSSYTAFQKPKVGFGVVCRCPGSGGVQCLLQKRGPNSASPNKWSFPGGRLEHPGDLEDDGDVGTRRELEEECGGGSPYGLPSLIHIECYKSGKVKQTIYHVYAIDTSTNKEWELWQPKAKNDKGMEIDTTAIELVVNGQTFPSCNGYCWADMYALIQECERLSNPAIDINCSDLQHGLVRWVQNYGDHVFRTLIQRSPKLPHSPRRHSSSSTGSSSGTNGSTAKPHPKADLTPKQQRYRMGDTGMLQPPFTAIRLPTHFQPTASHSPTQTFYASQMSPTGGGLVNSQPGVVVQIPALLPTSTVSPQHLVQGPSPMQGGMMYIPPVGFQPSPGSPGTGLLLQGVSQSEPGKEVGPAAVSTLGGGADLVGSGSTDVSTKFMQMQSASAFHQPPSQLPVSIFPDQSQQHQQAVGVPPQLAAHTHPAVSNSLHEQPQQPPQQPAASTAPNAPLATPAIPVPALATMERTEALLPIPPVISSVPPITATAPGHLQSLNNRKEILCRYFVAGQCPYGEKCWFAHPEPVGMPQFPQRDFASLPHTSIPTSPLRIQVPQHQIWNPNLSSIPLEMATGGYVASPPQSPMSTQLSSAAPSGIRPPILPPYPFPGQPPLIFWQSSPGRGPRNFPLLPTLRPHLTVPIDPMLRFSLLAEVVVQPDKMDSPLPRNISQLTSRADHFYVGFEDQVRDYKILFSGQHSYQESWTLQDKFVYPHKVTCLHCSRQQPYLLAVGTEAGQVFTCVLRKGNHFGHSSNFTTQICALEPPTPISSLVHFSTSVSQAQVIVVGTEAGSVSWYISQPPQKTYSLLYSDHQHSPHSVVSLQVWGGLLVSGSHEGKVLVWSMRSQQPVVDSEQRVHPHSLSDIHVLDNSVILTVGRGPSLLKEDGTASTPSSEQVAQMSVSAVSTASNGLLDSSQDVGTGVHPPGMEKMVQDMTQLRISSDPATPFEDTVTLWQYGVPLRPTKMQSNLGEIVTTAFYQAHTGNMFLAVGLRDGTVKILNLPNFSIASELHFPEMEGKGCLHVALNLSRDAPLMNPNYYRNPFRDLILITAWSDGKVMICQVARQQ